MGKRNAGILGNRAVKERLILRFAGEDGIVRCVSCGRTDITWHHIVPIEVGGFDVEGNIAPVCNDCHIAIHSQLSLQQRMASARSKIGNYGGRPRLVPDNYKELLNDYIRCRIGKRELSERWGVMITSRKNPGKSIPVDMVRLTDKSWYKDYLQELGIERVENKVDFWKNLRVPRGHIEVGEYVGTIYYKDGRVEDLHKQTS